MRGQSVRPPTTPFVRLPSAYPNQIPTNKAMWDAPSTAEDSVVDGYTFHAYSMVPMMISLHRRQTRSIPD